MGWQIKWPKEPGKWWFYGRMFRDSEVELVMVDVWKVSNGFAYVAKGHFLYAHEWRVGKWLKAELPQLPDGGV